ncbi:Tol-Pal system beta propeller repeat protein TolB [Sphingomonas sp.]|uniref:Tol-Pal system beta propeller repeat protein TolB n=1 Tax=Sphingomonas sp. TaxID=28214 RepID=UPI00286C151B|nr:Tol-Pal system beta propeller repeat protein TolB [Sphingomonas sp.]
MQGLKVKIWAAMLVLPSSAMAQGTPVTVVAVPQLATPDNVSTPAGDTGLLARYVADVITSDLRSTRELMPIGPENARVYSYPEATAPGFKQWSATGAKALVTGFVQARSDGRITVACYLHDIPGAREIARKGFVVAPAEWRRAAHRCSDAVYERLAGRPGSFDTRIAYVAESGSKNARVKRIALMDSDGTSHRYLTAGDSTVLTPRLTPGGERLAYVSYAGGQPQVHLIDLESNEDRPLLPGNTMSFAPRFSADGKRVLFGMAAGGNVDIYVVNTDGAALQRLTSAPGVDTAPAFSPDGSRIVFESDRSGTEQLYVMNADGTDQRRLTFGGARYASPSWSPDGERIAFTRAAGDGLRIGVITPAGADERILTNGPQDEGPSWAASGRDILFQRSDAGGRTGLAVVSVDGGNPRNIITPQDGSDPDWSTGAK